MTMEDMRWLVYDFEVFKYDWLCAVLNPINHRANLFWNNDIGEFIDYISEHADDIFVSFNGKHYDRYIFKAIWNGCSPEEVKEINDWVISGQTPWEHPYIKDVYADLNQCDLMDDCEIGLSLKAIEGHLGMDIRESSVDFNIDRPLTSEERREVEQYCIHDVQATEQLFRIREKYLSTKLKLASRAGISPEKALSLTNAKLTAAVLKATPGEWNDERDYFYPNNLVHGYVPKKAFEFFSQLHDESIPDDDLWTRSCNLMVGNCPCTIRWGGIHGAIPKLKLTSTDDYVLINADVSSYYPSLMVYNGYCSRAMSDASKFNDIYYERLEAKSNNDVDNATTLKLVVNTAFGATLNEFNDLYDPLMARSVCISGQLYLLELANHLVRVIPDIDIVQLNTDGILIGIKRDVLSAFHNICNEWQERTHFGLEFDEVERIWQKDVNNYALRLANGKEKVKGGYLVRGISTANAFKVNNTAVVIADALKKYLLDDIPVEETILACDDPKQYQIIAKASHKYSEVYQVTPEGNEPVQMCNRVFATTDESLGRLYKMKAGTGQVAKIESLPEHCLISNQGFPSIDMIDKSWYINLAQKRAKDFGGEEMATKAATPTVIDYSTMNVYQKLALARKMFLDAKPKKSGVNNVQEYDYFELADIVPIQTQIFAEVGLVELFWYEPADFIGTIPTKDGEIKPVFRDALAKAVVINVTNPEETLTFQLKWGNVPPIFNKMGKEVNTDIQRTGGEQTYMRRYLKMQILDIVEPDSVDREQHQPSEEEETAKPAPVKPPVASERAAIKDKLADSNGDATQLQIRQLKKSIKTMVDTYGEEHPEVSQYVAELSLNTEKLTKISKKDCEAAIQHLGDLKASYEQGDN